MFGLVHITRIADTILLIPIFFIVKPNLKQLIYLGIGFILELAPQIGAQYFYYGSVARNFYVTESSNQWSFQLIHLWEYLFSYQKGLFLWSPIYLFGIYGLIKQRRFLILLTLLFMICLGSFWSLHSAMTAGFGQRLALGSVPYFGIGIAYFYDKIKLHQQIFLTVALAIWNIFLLYGFYVLKWKNL